MTHCTFPHERLYQIIKGVLDDYHCHNMQGEDGNGLPLVDALTPPGDHSIDRGEHEIKLITDDIYNALLEKRMDT